MAARSSAGRARGGRAGWRVLASDGRRRARCRRGRRPRARGRSTIQRRARLGSHRDRHGRDGRVDHGGRPAAVRRRRGGQPASPIRSRSRAACSTPAGTCSLVGEGALAFARAAGHRRVRSRGARHRPPAEASRRARRGAARAAARSAPSPSIGTAPSRPRRRPAAPPASRRPRRATARSSAAARTPRARWAGSRAPATARRSSAWCWAPDARDFLKDAGRPRLRREGRRRSARRGGPRARRAHPARLARPSRLRLLDACSCRSRSCRRPLDEPRMPF